VELRDGGNEFGGKGVRHAVANVNGEIADAVVGRNAADQASLDRALIQLDGNENESRLRASAILAISLAVALARAAHAGCTRVLVTLDQSADRRSSCSRSNALRRLTP